VKCATVAMRCREGFRECLTEWLESGGDRALDVVIRKSHELIKNPARHPCPAADALSNAGTNQTASVQRPKLPVLVAAPRTERSTDTLRRTR
jgi:hypothetical protein